MCARDCTRTLLDADATRTEFSSVDPEAGKKGLVLSQSILCMQTDQKKRILLENSSAKKAINNAFELRPRFFFSDEPSFVSVITGMSRD